MNENGHPPHIKARKSGDLYFSPIWIVPILALLVSAWLIYKVVSESKIEISIRMPTAEGMVIGKTQIKMRGLHVGTVTAIDIAKDLSHVMVHAEVERAVEDYLTTETLWWVVKPQISLAGVSGLEAVLSGHYVAMEPSPRGYPITQFKIESQAPPMDENNPGLRVILESENLGSVSEGTQLYYRQIPIGKVLYYSLSDDTRSVQIFANIEDQYINLVNQSTVFWNSGGIRMSGSLSGFEVKTESLSALLAGGISLFTPEPGAELIPPQTRFPLYDNYEDAGVGIPVKVKFNSGYDLKSGITKVKYHGLDIGLLDSVAISAEGEGVVANINIDPGAEVLLNDETEFWLVKPNLQLSNLSNLDTLISGNYITLKAGMSETPQREFTALDTPPPPDFNEPGLHVLLQTEEMGSLSVGTPVNYKGVEVGRIVNISVDDLAMGIGVHVLIKPEYSQLVNASSEFTNTSGFEMSAGLGGIRIRSESFMTMVMGGINLNTPDPNGQAVEDGHRYQLISPKQSGAFKGQVKLHADSAAGLEAGFTALKYKGFTIGRVQAVEYNAKLDRVDITLGIDEKYRSLVKQDTVFWKVAPEITAEGAKGLDTLLQGVYLTLRPGNSSAEGTGSFELMNEQPRLSMDSPGLHLLLTAEKAGSLKAGQGVYHKGIKVGEVTYISLKAENAEAGIEVGVRIDPDYESLVAGHSQFFNASGISVRLGAGGAEVKTEGLSSILSGGIAFNTPDLKSNIEVQDGDRFKLHASESAIEREGFNILMRLSDETVVKAGAGITYKGLTIGEVQKVIVNPETDEVELLTTIQHAYRGKVTSGSRFWLAKTEFGLLRQKNLANLLSGPEIRLLSGEGAEQNEFVLSVTEPVLRSRPVGLDVTLVTNRLGSAKVGIPVLYRQIKVGEVIGYELSDNASEVLIYLSIYPEHEHLVRTNSVFWNASGIELDAGLFSGVNVRTDSIETIIGGGIALATPDEPGEQAQDGRRYRLEEEVDEDWLDWTPSLKK